MKNLSGKASLVIALVFALVITLIPVMPGNYSYGATTFAGGDGTLSNPYQITTKAQLNSVRNYPTKSFKLMNDINFTTTDFLSGGVYYNGGKGWAPIGASSTPFTGNFNGNGKKISGLTITLTAGGDGGLFGINNGIISNLGIYGGTISVTGNAMARGAGIAAQNGGTIQNCYNSATIISGGTAGGIVGNSANGTIKKCFNAGAVTGFTEVGGVCGWFGEGTLSYCYNTGAVTGNATSAGDHIGGIAGASDTCTLMQCYNTGTVTAAHSTTGGITAYVSDTILTACYYLAGTGANTSGTSLTSTQMGESTSFTGFNFTTVWMMNSSNHRPALQTCPVRPAALTTFSMNLSTTYSDVALRYRAIMAKWATVANANGYKVLYRKSSATSSSVGYVTTTAWSLLGDAGSKYYVKVIPYVSIAGVKYYAKSYSPETWVYTLQGLTLQLSKSGTQDVKVQWSNIGGETGYCIYRKTGSTGSWTKIKAIASVAAISWTDSSTVKGKTYYYKVRAYKTVGSSNVYGPYSTEKSIRL